MAENMLNQNDHDTLIRLETKTDIMLTRFDAFSVEITKQLSTFDKRIGDIEKQMIKEIPQKEIEDAIAFTKTVKSYKWMASFVGAALVTAISAAVYFVLNGGHRP